MYSSFFFDMDGVLFNSMPNHALAWDEVMHRHGLEFSARDTYINEGRTGKSVIDECYRRAHGTDAPDGLWQEIYREKSEMFERLGAAQPISGINELLDWLREEYTPQPQIWIVTGSGQATLFARLGRYFPAVFMRDRMITAADVTHGKPDPEPYLRAWERSGCRKEDCLVVENAPLGIRSANAAGLDCIGVNTGILSRADLAAEQPYAVFNNMPELLRFLQIVHFLHKEILPLYDSFDKGHNRDHAMHVIRESMVLCRDCEFAPNEQITDDDRQLLSYYISKGKAQAMAYTIAAYHDVGLTVDREHHHLNSGKAIRTDVRLLQWYKPEEIEIMAQAAEDHRASSKQPPRSIFGKIVAEADRDINVDTVIRRAVQFGLRNEPQLNNEEQAQRAYNHLVDKYAEGGYMHLWLNSARNMRELERLRNIIGNKDEVMKIILNYLPNQ